MTQFACGYCGSQQLVERKGGTISLEPVTEAIGRVQVGTDKTAAELAITRLHSELRALTEEKKEHTAQANAEIEKANKGCNSAFWVSFFVGWILGSMLCNFLFGPDYGVLGLGIGILAGLIMRGMARGNEETRLRNLLMHTLEPLETQIAAIREKIRVNKLIVDA